MNHENERVFAAKRGRTVFQVVVCGTLVAVGLSTAVVGTKSGGDYHLIGLGVLVTVMFGFVLAQTLRSMGAPLRLTGEGFEFDKQSFAWAAVQDVQPVSATHLRVTFNRGADLSLRAKVSVALGATGFYTAPAYIPRKAFDTDGVPLDAILREWLQRNGTSRQGR